MGLQAKTAVVVRDGVEKEVPLEEVVIGDIILVKPGEKKFQLMVKLWKERPR